MNKSRGSLTDYLIGDRFSNGLNVDMSTFGSVELGRRVNVLTEMSKGKKIIHFGCADHIPLIKDKINNGQHLHTLFCDAAERVVGLDYNRDAIEMMTKELGIQDVYLFDLFVDKLPEEIEGDKFDYLILGEILEHVDNPVDFLKTIKEKFSRICRKIVITVPNIASDYRYKTLKNNVEHINTDHRYWFTPYTLSKVVTMAGLDVEEIKGCDSVIVSFEDRVRNKLGIFIPRHKHANTLIAIAEI